jgi:transposase-like protein/transposase
MTYHDNAKTTVHQRKIIKTSKEPYRTLAKQLGVSVPTVAKWKKREQPTDRTSRPKHIRRALPSAMEPVLDFLRRDWLVEMDTIWIALQKTIFPQLTRSAVYRQLVRQGIQDLKKLRVCPQRPLGKFRASPPGFLHIDIFVLPKLDDKKLYLFVAIDRATRLLTMQAYPNKDAQMALKFLEHCRKFYPFRIQRILTDNGSAFTNRFYLNPRGARPKQIHVFTQTCRQVHIHHILTKSYHPWTNGLAERAGQTIKKETIHRFHYDSSSQMVSALYGFERYFNYHRPYKAMGGKTPYELMQYWYKKQPKRFLREPMCITTL